MTTPRPRWSLIGTSKNDYGVTFFTIACRDANGGDADYHELMAVLKRDFGAVERGELKGPYSVHKFVSAKGFVFGILLDSPDWLDLLPINPFRVTGFETLVTQLLEALNELKATDAAASARSGD